MSTLIAIVAAGALGLAAIAILLLHTGSQPGIAANDKPDFATTALPPISHSHAPARASPGGPPPATLVPSPQSLPDIPPPDGNPEYRTLDFQPPPYRCLPPLLEARNEYDSPYALNRISHTALSNADLAFCYRELGNAGAASECARIAIREIDHADRKWLQAHLANPYPASHPQRLHRLWNIQRGWQPQSQSRPGETPESMPQSACAPAPPAPRAAIKETTQ